MNYKIEIGYRPVLPPVKFNDETDEDFEVRRILWETEEQYKSFWRTVVMDETGMTPQHFAINSPLFHRVESGAKELRELMESAAVVLERRQASKKNEIANLTEVG
jgi:hypothetical protein